MASEAGGSMNTRRHPAEVTGDRLRDALDKWPDAFDAGDRDAIGRILFVLDEIVEGRVA